MHNSSLIKLFSDHFGSEPESLKRMPLAGSHREYYRMGISGETFVGVYSPDPRETRAFLEFTKHFLRVGLNVPELIAEDPGKGIYLLQDLGDLTLKEEVDRSRESADFPGRVIPFYKKALEQLIRFQTEAHSSLDYTICVPRQEFDSQSVLWDLNHFKYFFLKILGIPFDEQALEDDFRSFAALLDASGKEHFLYRDFQSRNIMLHEDKLWFIDYQGGRRGALPYDVASLLFESRVNLPQDVREELLEHYLEQLGDPELVSGFRESYYSFVLIRILQVLGAYGIRGIVEGKALFLQSIPYALKNLEWLGEQNLLPDGLPELGACIEKIIKLEEWKSYSEPAELTVHVNSFSYKKGVPRDLSGNGGGFVFDCRALPNPGREEKYRALTGLDREVIEFLEPMEEVGVFLEKTFSLVESSVETYRGRRFTSLWVSFGCTGGQHRSVFCAERMNAYLQDRLKVKSILKHRELKKED